MIHNHEGFRDREHGPKTKPRILFLGDSLVWGYDADQEERFTEKLQEKLPDIEILNFGISGYGTDQELLLLEKEYDRYQPDLVFLIVSPNDRRDNSSNISYGFGKPYFIKENGKLSLRGVPVLKSSVYSLKKEGGLLKKSVLMNLGFLVYEKLIQRKIPDLTEDLVLELDSFLKQKGGVLAVSWVEQDVPLKEFCDRHKILTLDLRRSNEKGYRFPSFGKHWTPAGHRFVSEQIYGFLEKGNYLRTFRRAP